jgi:hypothetical protein
MKSKHYTVCPHCKQEIEDKDVKMLTCFQFSDRDFELMCIWGKLEPYCVDCEKCEFHAKGIGCFLDQDEYEKCPHWKEMEGDDS